MYKVLRGNKWHLQFISYQTIKRPLLVECECNGVAPQFSTGAHGGRAPAQRNRGSAGGSAVLQRT